MATGGGAVMTSTAASAQAQGAADGLPIYDDRRGRPRSGLVDIAPPRSVSSPMIETPDIDEPEVSMPEPMVEPVIEAAAATRSAPEPMPEPDPVAAAPEPESEVEVINEPEPEQTVTAAVEPAAVAPQPSVPAIPGTIAVLFPAGGAELPSEAQPQLDSVVAALGADSGVRLQLKAYADGSDGAASAARRLSLSRALAVRGYLIDAGVSSTRIDVRALGSKYESGPADRVDVISVE